MAEIVPLTLWLMAGHSLDSAWEEEPELSRVGGLFYIFAGQYIPTYRP